LNIWSAKSPQQLRRRSAAGRGDGGLGYYSHCADPVAGHIGGGDEDAVGVGAEPGEGAHHDPHGGVELVVPGRARTNVLAFNQEEEAFWLE
jgi:hypothetical protein